MFEDFPIYSNGTKPRALQLVEPFTHTEYAHRAPLAYAAAVTEGLRRSVDGDAAYSGLMTKNPEHECWASHRVTDHLYTLDELAFWLDDTGFLPPNSWKRARRKNPFGLGRNCA
ncbi:replication initiation protein [Corynebacterium belfantii]|uniref:replication initiation protein n=3 Tax=Corynebacterium TaxID=1716 RepID=UPI000DC1D26B|nr:replication initiation protein [Corynebacterium belfantii]QVI99431.1 replication initiation protein [Corynebacterium diphtheriae]SPJ42268.1 Replicase family protein [Corynebacterium diphtheriae subsp. lausannense]MBG9244005.1 replication initiation protein [Corynebacterium belfantii]MBG9259146.1 replication initiation protein [Corynebacterium belfantii]MBG9265887.1 replication initiation protein [Corynebacterium belfantii]